MSRLAIFGAGGHGKVIADAAELASWREIEFFDDTWPERGHHMVWPISGNMDMLIHQLHRFDGVVVAVGNNQSRYSICKKVIAEKGNLVSIIHPTAIVSKYTKIGYGTVVFAGAVINAGVKLGIGCIINTVASVDHDCIIGDAVHISPGSHLAGEVTVGDLSWIGIGACIRQNTVIGRMVMVGAGAAVVNHIPEKTLAVGVPAVVRGDYYA